MVPQKQPLQFYPLLALFFLPTMSFPLVPLFAAAHATLCDASSAFLLFLFSFQDYDSALVLFHGSSDRFLVHVLEDGYLLLCSSGQFLSSWHYSSYVKITCRNNHYSNSKGF
jgi:hypothetical protein